jgi:hypothetical protein
MNLSVEKTIAVREKANALQRAVAVIDSSAAGQESKLSTAILYFIIQYSGEIA